MENKIEKKVILVNLEIDSKIMKCPQNIKNI